MPRGASEGREHRGVGIPTAGGLCLPREHGIWSARRQMIPHMMDSRDKLLVVEVDCSRDAPQNPAGRPTGRGRSMWHDTNRSGPPVSVESYVRCRCAGGQQIQMGVLCVGAAVGRWMRVDAGESLPDCVALRASERARCRRLQQHERRCGIAGTSIQVARVQAGIEPEDELSCYRVLDAGSCERCSCTDEKSGEEGDVASTNEMPC